MARGLSANLFRAVRRARYKELLTTGKRVARGLMDTLGRLLGRSRSRRFWK